MVAKVRKLESEQGLPMPDKSLQCIVILADKYLQYILKETCDAIRLCVLNMETNFAFVIHALYFLGPV